MLLSKLEINLKEKEDLSISHNKLKKDFDAHMITCHTKITMISINQKEISEMKKKINHLSSILSKCAFNKIRIYVF